MVEHQLVVATYVYHRLLQEWPRNKSNHTVVVKMPCNYVLCSYVSYVRIIQMKGSFYNSFILGLK